MRYFIQLSFDGRDFHGWQVQPNAASVQQTLAEALTLLLRTPIEVVGAGRTDAGVNASMMVAHFDWEGDMAASFRGCDGLCYKLNRILPPTIALQRIYPVQPEAHARFSATSRTYHYYVCTHKSPFHRHYAMRLPYAVDFGAMNKAARILLDTRDFTSFSKLHTDTKTNICRVTAAHWDEVEPGLWRFTITADRFLRNMVRAVVGTLLEVGRGRLSEEGLHAIIAQKDRCAAGDSVVGNALFLSDVSYPDEIHLRVAMETTKEEVDTEVGEENGEEGQA